MTEYDDNQWADVLGEVLEAAELRPALDQALEDNDALSSSLI